jgi:hypothetical protein
MGDRVRVLLLGNPAALKGDAAAAAQRWSGPVVAARPTELTGAGLVIDALFGAGLDRPVKGGARAMIEAVNACGAPVLAVDLPSGINGATGAVMGAAVRAAETVTFFRRKPGHVLMPGRLHCGRVRVGSIGIPDAVLADVQPRTFANAPALWGHAFPVPRADGHKYARGHAVVVSGGISTTGAARLAARAALRAVTSGVSTESMRIGIRMFGVSPSVTSTSALAPRLGMLAPAGDHRTCTGSITGTSREITLVRLTGRRTRRPA